MTTLTTPQSLRTLYDPVRERSAAKELQQLDVHATRFISLSPFVVVATGGVDGMDASPRGGARPPRGQRAGWVRRLAVRRVERWQIVRRHRVLPSGGAPVRA